VLERDRGKSFDEIAKAAVADITEEEQSASLLEAAST
jgi:hypothetical protein